jgi:hypothetical protein
VKGHSLGEGAASAVAPAAAAVTLVVRGGHEREVASS